VVRTDLVRSGGASPTFGEALAAVAGALTGPLGGVVNAWLFLVKATS
jgi:hypothetical protein